MRHRRSLTAGAVVAAGASLLWSTSASDLLADALFSRPGTASCVPQSELGRGPALPLRALTEAEIAAFERDGSVVLRGVLSDEWVGRLRALVADVFKHPNVWDVLYSRLVANFYCAQKAILVHHTSACGREVAEAAPTTALAAALLRTSRLRVAEPTDALGNLRHTSSFADGCGTTGYHTDDAYMPVARADPGRAAVVRLWMPLADFGPQHFPFAPLNDSAPSRAARAAAGVVLNGTNYARHAALVASGLADAQELSAGALGVRRGDVFAFAATTPHVAEARDCAAPAAGACLRLILSFAGDNARYAGGRAAGLIPLRDNQTTGAPLRGAQFPTVWPEMAADEWAAPFRPGARTVAAAIANAVRAGSRSFAGAGAATAARYVGRVAAFAAPWANAWDDADGRPVSLVAHFGGALARWAVR